MAPLGAFAYTPCDGETDYEDGACGSGQGVYFALTLGASRSLEERVSGLLKEVDEIKQGGKDVSGWRMKLQQDKAQLLMFDCVEKEKKLRRLEAQELQRSKGSAGSRSLGRFRFFMNCR